MNTVSAKQVVQQRKSRTITVILRTVLIVNFLRLALSFSSRFEGSERTVGWIDRALGNSRVGGFRIDFLWLVLSTIAILVATVYFFTNSKAERPVKLDFALSIAWLFAFAIYIMRSLLTGTFYPG